MGLLSYTNKDYNSLKEGSKAKIPSLTTKWTDFNHSDIGMVLLSLMSGIGDMLAFYLDKQALECYLPNVTERKNCKSILNLINYKMDPVISATSVVTCTLSKELENSARIPKYTVLSTRTDADLTSIKYFCTTEEKTLNAGQLSVDVPVKEGIKTHIRAHRSDIINNSITLPDLSIASKSVLINIDGYDWNEVDDLLSVEIRDRIFEITLDKNDKTVINLISNHPDYILDDSSLIDITYLVSSGPDGNIGYNTIVTIHDPIYDSKGTDITSLLSITNPVATTGGSDLETIDQARIKAPKELKTTWLAVILDDYKVLAESYPGVERASAVDWTIPGGGITNPFQVKVVIVPRGGGLPSSPLKSSVLSYLNGRKTAGVEVIMADPDYLMIPIDITIYRQKNKGINSVIQSDAENAINEYFKIENIDFGQPIYLSNLTAMIQNISPYVSHISIKLPTDNVAPNTLQIVRISSMSIQVKEVGE